MRRANNISRVFPTTGLTVTDNGFTDVNQRELGCSVSAHIQISSRHWAFSQVRYLRNA